MADLKPSVRETFAQSEKFDCPYCSDSQTLQASPNDDMEKLQGLDDYDFLCECGRLYNAAQLL